MNTCRSKTITFALAGLSGALVAYVPAEIIQGVIELWSASPVLKVLAAVAVMMAIYAVAYCLALTIGQNRYLRRPLLGGREALINVGGGAVIGMLSGFLAQVFFTIAVLLGQGNPLSTEAARVVAWGMFGALIGLGMSFIIPNLGRLHGLAGGGLGAVVGAIGFIIATVFAGDAAGRFLGLATVGLALGYAIGFAEEASRHAWLEVCHGSVRETVRVTLGPELVCVGSDSQRCAVWAPGARAIELRFRFADGRVTCDDMVAERSMVVDSGFERRVGNVTVVVQAAASTLAVVNAGNSASPVAAPPPPPPPPTVRPPIQAPARRVTATRGAADALPGITRAGSSSSAPAAPPPPPPPPPPPRRKP
jgi:hypothetical protein